MQALLEFSQHTNKAEDSGNSKQNKSSFVGQLTDLEIELAISKFNAVQIELYL